MNGVVARIFATRALRNAGYGWLTVALALLLEQRGYTSQLVGALFTIGLIAGAGYAASTPRWVRRFDRRTTLVVASLLMAASGSLLWFPRGYAPTLAAMLLGTVGLGTQEVGPFSSLEQTLIADAAGSKAATVFGYYNLVGSFAIAIGAAMPAVLPADAAPLGYAAIALVLAGLYATMPHVPTPPREKAPIASHVPRAVERLAVLFAVDAFGGGIIVQSFMAYWFSVRFHAPGTLLGELFFAANTIAAISLLFAAPLARRIGPVRTMVFTHLPSNVLLAVIPLVPSFEWAATILVARFALSQMDVPVRQAMVMSIVSPEERPRAAGLTNAIRPAAAALGPAVAGVTMATASIGLPFYLAGGIKIAYDLTVFGQFHELDAKLLSKDARRA